MRRHVIILALASTMSGGSAALAADMARPAIVKAMPAAVADWTGFYVGGAVGFRAADVDANLTSFLQNGLETLPGFCDPTFGCVGQEFDSIGFKGGVYAGFNWQFAPRWVAGIEADFMWADHQSVRHGMIAPSSAGVIALSGVAADSFSVATEWDASIRARLGFLVTPSIMIYATGGASWASLETQSTCNALFAPCAQFAGTLQPLAATTSDSVLGWTVGAGIEAMLSPNWLLRAEYRYADYGTHSYAIARSNGVDTLTWGYDVDLKTHSALVGLAYKFGGGASPLSARAQAFAEPAPAVASWSGFYVGAAAGLRAADVEGNVTSLLLNAADILPPICAGVGCTGQPLDSIGFKGGIYGGYNWHFAPSWVAGLEGDWMWADQEAVLGGALSPSSILTAVGGFTSVDRDSFSVRAEWDASLRARLGYLVTPSLMVFATGGVTWMKLDTVSSCNGPCPLPLTLTPDTTSTSETLVGWTIGAGVEAALSRNWLIRGEYRYADYGTQSYSTARTTTFFPTTVTTTYDVSVRTHTALFGVAYKFDWGASVTAKN